MGGGEKCTQSCKMGGKSQELILRQKLIESALYCRSFPGSRDVFSSTFRMLLLANSDVIIKITFYYLHFARSGHMW